MIEAIVTIRLRMSNNLTDEKLNEQVRTEAIKALDGISHAQAEVDIDVRGSGSRQ